MLHGLDKRLSMETGIPTYLAEDPLSCVAIGTGKALDCLEALHDNVTQGNRRD